MPPKHEPPRNEKTKLPRRVESKVNHLDVYGLLFGDLIVRNQHEERIEVEIEHSPLNQLATIKVTIPASNVRKITNTLELFKISRKRDGHDQYLPIEITNVHIYSGLSTIATTHKSNQTYISATVDATAASSTSISFEFTAWELVGIPHGQAPYLSSTLGLSLELGSDIETCATIVLLKTPKSITPRCTQGNHILAYPSRTTEEHRLLSLYFANSRIFRIAYTSGGTDDLTSPWETLARAAASAALVFLVLSAAAGTVSLGERFIALLAAFFAAGQVSWSAARELVAFSVYGKHSRRISATVLTINLLLLATFISALLSLSGVVPIPLDPVRWTSIALAAIAGIGAGIGLSAHWAGSLQGYTCDFQGCHCRLGLLRRQRVECRYTGRVFCDKHIDLVCTHCVHGADLDGESIGTRHLYTKDSPLCLRAQKQNIDDSTQAEQDKVV